MDLSDKKYLVAIGCSHMAGSEIEGPGYTDRSKINLLKAWPGIIAKHYNLNYINQSQPGGSNDYLLRQTVEFVAKWIEQGRDTSELFIVLGWTTNERIEFTWEGKHIHWANGSNPKAFMHGPTGEGWDFTNWYKALQLYHTDYDFGFYKKIINMITANSFLKMHGINHIQVSNCARIVGDEFKHFNWTSLEHSFPNDVFFEKYNSFIQRYEETHKEHFTDWMHADQEIHSLYAKDLIQFIEDKI